MKLYTVLTLFIGLFLSLQAPVLAMDSDEDNWFEGEDTKLETISTGVKPGAKKLYYSLQEEAQVSILALEFDMKNYYPLSKEDKNYQDLIKNVQQYKNYQDLIKNVQQVLSKNGELGKLIENTATTGLIWIYLEEPKTLLDARSLFEKIDGITSVKDGKEYSTQPQLFQQLFKKNEVYIGSKALENLKKERQETKEKFEEKKEKKSESASSNKLEIKQPTDEYVPYLNFSDDEEIS